MDRIKVSVRHDRQGPPEPTRRILVVYHSSTGDVLEVINTLLAASFGDSRIDITWFELRADRPLTLPASLRALFNTAPETIGVGPAEISVDWSEDRDQFDLIVLGWQVWWLRPSAPVRAFLASPLRERLRNRDVILVGCSRQMWVSAHHHLVRLVTAAGGRLAANIMVRYQGSGVTLITTPLKLLTGRPDLFRGLPPAKLRSDELKDVFACGRRLRVSLRRRMFDHWDPLLGRQAPAYSEPKYRVPELVGSAYMALWGPLFHPRIRRILVLREPLIWIWATGFAVGLATVVPLWALFWTLFVAPWRHGDRPWRPFSAANDVAETG